MDDIPAKLEALAAAIRAGTVQPICVEDTRIYLTHPPVDGEVWGRAELIDTRQILLRFRDVKGNG